MPRELGVGTTRIGIESGRNRLEDNTPDRNNTPLDDVDVRPGEHAGILVTIDGIELRPEFDIERRIDPRGHRIKRHDAGLLDVAHHFSGKPVSGIGQRLDAIAGGKAAERQKAQRLDDSLTLALGRLALAVEAANRNIGNTMCPVQVISHDTSTLLFSKRRPNSPFADNVSNGCADNAAAAPRTYPAERNGACPARRVSGKHVTFKACLEILGFGCRKRTPIGIGTLIKGGRGAFYFFSTAMSPTPISRMQSSISVTNASIVRCDNAVSAVSRSFSAFQGQKEVQGDQFEPPFRCVRHAHIGVKSRLPCRGHDTAIKLSCSAIGFGAPPEPLQHASKDP